MARFPRATASVWNITVKRWAFRFQLIREGIGRFLPKLFTIDPIADAVNTLQLLGRFGQFKVKAFLKILYQRGRLFLNRRSGLFHREIPPPAPRVLVDYLSADYVTSKALHPLDLASDMSNQRNDRSVDQLDRRCLVCLGFIAWGLGQ